MSVYGAKRRGSTEDWAEIKNRILTVPLPKSEKTHPKSIEVSVT